jgi:transcription elongation factor GreB
MSRAFLKDDTQDEKLFIPPRAPLPPGAVNYVTPRGLAQLRAELTDLEARRSRVQTDTTDEPERKRQLALLAGQIAELTARLGSAVLVNPANQPPDEVRFGATVTLHTTGGRTGPTERRLTLVGVDEAAAAEGRVAFTAPIARVLTGHRVGDTVALRTGRGEERLKITEIEYEAS